MFRRLAAAFAAFALMSFAATGIAVAAVDVNSADAKQLETIKGIGPAISAKIVAERQKGDYKDWDDLVKRVPGIGDKNSATMSQSGLTVGGRAKADAPAAPPSGVDQGIARATRQPPLTPSGEVPTKTTNSMPRPGAPAAAATTDARATKTAPPPAATDAKTTQTTQTTKRTSTTDSASAPATTETQTTKTVATPVGPTKETKTSTKTDNDASAKTEMAKSKSTDAVTTETAPKKARAKKGDTPGPDDAPKK